MKVERFMSKIMKLTLCVNMVFCFQLSLSKVHGQEYVHVNFPDNLCAGTIDTVSFGYDSDNDISLVLRHASLGQAGRAFLPDGVECGSMGCSYRSTVTFTDFAPTAHISSIQDIKYVRLNIEHSWIGDIYIGITCPNGQKASLMKGSEYNDPIIDVEGHTSTNHSGGINGGISNGNPVVFTLDIRPAASIAKTQQTFSWTTGKTEKLSIGGRHDACIALRCPVIAESVAAIALADILL